MFPLLRSLTVRYLLQKWDRSVLVALSIALGVATLVSTRLLNQCVEAAALDSTVPADVADLYADNGEIGVDWAVAEDLKAARIPGVRRVQPFVVVRVVMPEIGDRSAVVFGSDLSARESDARNADFLKVKFTPINPIAFAGRWIAMSRSLYEARKSVGKSDTDSVEIRYTNVTEKFLLAGVIDVANDSPIAPFARNMLAMEIKTAARLHRRPGADP